MSRRTCTWAKLIRLVILSISTPCYTATSHRGWLVLRISYQPLLEPQTARALAEAAFVERHATGCALDCYGFHILSLTTEISVVNTLYVHFWLWSRARDRQSLSYQACTLLSLSQSADSGPLGVGYTNGFQQPRSNETAMVPQLTQQQFTRLTTSQQAELELARRRAQKAAEGKRANATAAR